MDKGTVEHQNPAAGADEALESLLKNASARPEPSETVREEVRQALHGEWRARSARRRRLRHAAGFSLAAAAALVLAVALWRGGEQATQPVLRELALIERVSGNVRLMPREPGVPGTAAVPGIAVYEGQRLLTGEDSGIALRLEDGLSVRVDQTTEIVLLDEFAAELRDGRVYVDTEATGATGPPAPGSRFQLFTPMGAVSHVGTQYLVRVQPALVQVSVRRGSATLTAVDGTTAPPVYVRPGQKLVVGKDGRHELAQAAADGEAWQWAEALGPGFDLEGKTLAEFLDWVSSETGLEIAYASEDVRSVAERTVLHGRADLPAREALDVVMLSSDLQAELEEGMISIMARP